ncbi:MAG: hypothetical protein LUO98_08845 [Methanoregula sp.]|nr:hypothetical protein [Methanoregula sp.]
MIGDADTIILEVLQKGLSKELSADAVYIGEFDPKRAKSLSLVCSAFSVEEEGIGGSGGIKRETVSDDFATDGKTAQFTLSQKPVRPLISVETPPGTAKNTPDDYTVDYDRGLVTLRVVPEKKAKLRISYYVDRPVAETRTIRLLLTYHLTIGAKSREERDAIVTETIRVLYRERSRLEKQGISEVKLVRGYTESFPEEKGTVANVLEYQAQTTVQIEIPMPPIARIEIEGR